jgi:hypothetical protein
LFCLRALLLVQAQSSCRQLKQQLLHMDRDIAKAGEQGCCWMYWLAS